MTNQVLFWHEDLPYELHLLGEELGRGVSSTVEKATGDPILSEESDGHPSLRLAVKHSRQARFNAVLAAEAALLRELDGHVNVMRVLREYEAGGLKHLVLLPRVHGTLERIVAVRTNWSDANAAGRLPLHGAPAIIAMLSRAVAYLLRKGAVHRDLAAKNVGIGRGGILCLLDFGCGRLLGEGARASNFPYGSPGFSAPEIIYGGSDHSKCDVFSLGCIVAFLLSGSSPFLQGREGTEALTMSALQPREPRYRRQAAKRFALLLGPPTPTDLDALAPELRQMADDDDAGGKEQQKTIMQLYSGRCQTAEQREEFISSITSLLMYSPGSRASPWDVCRRFLPLMRDDQIRRYLGDVTEDERDHIRTSLDPDSARDLLGRL